jgi:hypothetical protein
MNTADRHIRGIVNHCADVRRTYSSGQPLKGCCWVSVTTPIREHYSHGTMIPTFALFTISCGANSGPQSSSVLFGATLDRESRGKADISAAVIRSRVASGRSRSRSESAGSFTINVTATSRKLPPPRPTHSRWTLPSKSRQLGRARRIYLHVCGISADKLIENSTLIRFNAIIPMTCPSPRKTRLEVDTRVEAPIEVARVLH